MVREGRRALGASDIVRRLASLAASAGLCENGVLGGHVALDNKVLVYSLSVLSFSPLYAGRRGLGGQGEGRAGGQPGLRRVGRGNQGQREKMGGSGANCRWSVAGVSLECRSSVAQVSLKCRSSVAQVSLKCR